MASGTGQLLSHSNYSKPRKSVLKQTFISSWNDDILTDRKQRVVVNRTSSDWSAVTSGVPQGTVLGPVLFLLYINDLPNNISSNVKLFADDSVVYRQIQRVEDHSILQQDLLNLEQWTSLWQMNFAPSKCYTLSVTLKKKPSPFVYSLCDSSLEGVKIQKYLGVYISSTLS